MNYWITARRGRMGNVQWGIGMCEARACVGARHAVPVRGKGWAMGQWGNGAWAMGNVAWACGMCRGTACLARSNEDK